MHYNVVDERVCHDVFKTIPGETRRSGRVSVSCFTCDNRQEVACKSEESSNVRRHILHYMEIEHFHDDFVSGSDIGYYNHHPKLHCTSL